MLAFRVTGAPVSGGAVFEKDLRGIGPVRVYLRNNGPDTITGAVLAAAPEVGGAYATVDDETFDSMASGAVRVAAVAAPVDVLKLTPSVGGGDEATCDVWVATTVDQQDELPDTD